MISIDLKISQHETAKVWKSFPLKISNPGLINWCAFLQFSSVCAAVSILVGVIRINLHILLLSVFGSFLCFGRGFCLCLCFGKGFCLCLCFGTGFCLRLCFGKGFCLCLCFGTGFCLVQILRDLGQPQAAASLKGRLGYRTGPSQRQVKGKHSLGKYGSVLASGTSCSKSTISTWSSS